jgi:hypothetical protein
VQVFLKKESSEGAKHEYASYHQILSVHIEAVNKVKAILLLS